MPNGFAGIPASRFPNEKLPTLFHPASPKMKPVDASKTSNTSSAKDVDAASMASTSTFASTVSLLKNKFHHKEHQNKEKTGQKADKEAYMVYGSTKS
ncbi:hypothetical protein B7463_g661, partial [Scytalidium lignicola]